MYQFTKDESFCEILESVLFKIEVLILIKVSFLHTFESFNTFFYQISIFRKKKLLMDVKAKHVLLEIRMLQAWRPTSYFYSTKLTDLHASTLICRDN